MHPVFSRPLYFVLYLAAWVPLGAMLSVLVAISGGMTAAEAIAITAPMNLLFAYVCLGPWYTCRSLPFRSTPPWKLVAYHGLAAILCSTGVLVLARGLASVLTGMFPGVDHRFHLGTPVCAAMLFLIYLLSIAAHYVYLALRASHEAQMYARESELKALRSQVNPHFLFNSLNSISALTSADPAKARDMCIRLSDYLRTSLRMGERDAVSFSEEIGLAQTYLDVEQVRFGRRLRVLQRIDPVCEGCEAPPLLVQPLVENAVKHGIASLVEGGEIVLITRCDAGRLRFTVENHFDPEARPARGNGMGIANVRNRLRARYGDTAGLEIQRESDFYRATMTLPCGVKA